MAEKWKKKIKAANKKNKFYDESAAGIIYLLRTTRFHDI
jgi:hypothetical protein